MPTYEYRCPDGHEFENFVLKISAAKTELPCPTCGAVAPRRMSAGSGLLFKGSGFYITDYGKDGKKDQREAASAKAESKGAAAAKSDAGSGTSGGDSKSADKSSGAPASAAPTTAPSSSASSAPKPSAPAPSAPKPPKSGSSE